MSKSLMKNAFFNTLYKALTVVFPLFTVSYASHILGPAGIGNVSSAQNIVTYFTMFASLGIPSYGVRAIAKIRSASGKEKNQIFSELFLINALATSICIVAYLIMLNVFETPSTLNIIFGLLIVLNYFNIEWVYQGLEKYQYIAMRSLAIKVISLILMLILVKTKQDIWIYAIIVCFGTVGNYIFNMVQLRRYVNFRFFNLKVSRHFKPIIIFFASVLAIELYSLLDITMLTKMSNPESVGYFSNAVKIVKMLAGTFTAIGAVLLPRLSIYYSQNDLKRVEEVINTFLKIMIFISIPSCVGLVLISDKIVFVLFGRDFLPAIETIKILSPLLILMPLSGGVFGQLLLTTDKEKTFFKCVFFGTCVNVILNVILIPLYNQNGAAIASVATEAMVTALMLVACRKLTKIPLNVKYYLSIGISAFCMALVITLVEKIFSGVSLLPLMVLDVVLGALTYFIILLMLKNDIMLSAIAKLKRIK
ncbi:flippase [Bacillus sp. OK048]|uniref:flippase n=1 Tax=Bacillus sp. OK048 TaxID=1882761 RepID=UPI000882F18B|nr:flippase [Bacillus sp. OK048]SDN05593.1 Membrane protein involved in the export of O-antigen and teichoic acid [Bacillus sp. OK048]